jgi:hypothetical protein
MYFTHQFDHPESVTRFKNWLNQIGIEHREIETRTPGSPRIALTVEPRQVDAIRLLINAVERIAPGRSTLLWDQPETAPIEGRPGEPDPQMSAPKFRPGSVVIGWHPDEPAFVSGSMFRDS